ncbi:Ribosome-binding ATPase YchF [uncultured archaeon]|nr:Ribosome-binding ATPase YchF [uncultured archaeon]
MSISIGVVGKPNAGKSTFFSALTMADAKIAPFPFTTIEPNRGVAYVRKECPHTIKGKQCEPRDSSCVNGTRFIPIQVTDVAGIVPDAHLGKGLGLQFLDDIRQADALVQVIDASGRSDLEGNACEGCDPSAEVDFLEKEITHWIQGIIERNWAKVKGRPLSALYDVFASMKLTPAQAEAAAKRLGLPETLNWDEGQKLSFAEEVRKLKPIFIAANKADSAKPETLKMLSEKFAGRVAFCSAAYELALRKAAKAGAVEYVPGASSFSVRNANEEQQKALAKISDYLKASGGTGVQDALEKVVNNTLGLIAVYPVEDENKWSDRKGTVLPNVFLMRKNSTPVDLAAHVHTDLAKNFISAVDAKRHLRIGKDYILNDGDIIKIISG